MEHIYRPADSYFTADTHFGQERTLQLSRRPFVGVEEMDLTMVSNWNKRVPESGIVYHAGDFIDPAQIDKLPTVLSNLNFAELHWVLGNYDRKIKEQILETVKSGDLVNRQIFIYDVEDPCYVNLKKGDGTEVKFRVIHEPADFEYHDGLDVTYLFGHIHGRSFAKRNGFDIACDYSNYTPLSSEQVLWFKNAMQYWDKNVYCDRVNRVPEMVEYTLDATEHSYIWPPQAIHSFMRLPEEKRLVTFGKKESDYPVTEIDLSTAVGTIKDIQDGKILISVNKDWPMGKMVSEMLDKKIQLKFFLTGAADSSMIIERDVNDPGATIYGAQLKTE
jgi:calcineurin-like phosphoesterase family protein